MSVLSGLIGYLLQKKHEASVAQRRAYANAMRLRAAVRYDAPTNIPSVKR